MSGRASTSFAETSWSEIAVSGLEVDYLVALTSSTSIRTMSGVPKKLYKYYLCGIFNNMIGGRHRTQVQRQMLDTASAILKDPKAFRKADTELGQARSLVEAWWAKHSFIAPKAPPTVDNTIQFLRDRLDEIQRDGISMISGKDLSGLMDISKLETTTVLLPQHWVEFNIEMGLIPTYPVPIVWNDLKVHWNGYVEAYQLVEQAFSRVRTDQDRLKAIQDSAVREARLIVSAESRTLIFAGVTFAESFLFDLLHHLQESHGSIVDTSPVSTVMANPKINDTQILEDVLFVLFPNLKSETAGHYGPYRSVLKARDQYVHASARINPADNQSSLKSLLTHDHESLRQSLITCIELVRAIDSQMPVGLKLLWWWDQTEEIDFGQIKPVSLLGKDAAIARVDFFRQ